MEDKVQTKTGIWANRLFPGKLFTLELILALLLCTASAIAAFSNLAAAEAPLLSSTVDGPGHLTKVVYLAEHYRNLEFPSWCPFWYNGSTMMQYYAPLGYVTMAIIQILTGNLMLTVKWYCFLSLSVGGLGVWAVSRRFVGHWYGLFSIPVYCLQANLSMHLFQAGAYAQGMIYMLTPWLLLFVINFLLEPRATSFFNIAILTALLILGHAMHAFMIGLMIAITAFPFALTGRIRFKSYLMLGISMGLAALLCGFWWTVGITSYEAPGVPYLLEGATITYSATLRWFLPWRQAILSFNVSTLTAIPLGWLVYLLVYRKNSEWDKRRFTASLMILLSLISVVFSFGQNLKALKHVPLIDTLVPGRILSLAAASSAIVISYIFYSIFKNYSHRLTGIRCLIMLLSAFLIGLMFWEMNPFIYRYEAEDVSARYERSMALLPGEGEFFDKGRYEWIAPIDSIETYYASHVYKFNTADGWNIEGTPHNRAIWSHNIALMSGNEEYILKNLLFWNVRSVLIDPRFENLLSALENHGFEPVAARSAQKGGFGLLYASRQPSSYYLKDSRDCLAVGPGAMFLAHEFPYIVCEYETDLLKYGMEELMHYKVIYIIEPELKKKSRVKAFEKRITELVDAGVHVIIEPSGLQRLPVFGVNVNTLTGESMGAILYKTVSDIADENGSVDDKDVSLWAGRQLFSLKGLDRTEYGFIVNQDSTDLSAIGTKKVGTGEILFIGGRLSQYLASPSVSIWGFRENTIIPDVEVLKSIIKSLIDRKGHKSSFAPGVFNVLTSSWDYKGGEFSYELDKPEDITISVTYSPRWKVTLDDGMEIKARSRENLIVLDLPAGLHRVSLHYGISFLGRIGYGISFLGMVLLVLGTTFFLRFSYGLDNLLHRLGSWLQLPLLKRKQ